MKKGNQEMSLMFWICLIGSGYSYFIYPVIMLFVPKRKKACSRTEKFPTVSIVIAARNEEARIRDKLENTLSVVYPLENLEIIVASDASDDGTDDIVRSFCERGVRLVRGKERKGKEAAQKLAIQGSTGEILVFTDAATAIRGDAITRIVEVFEDPNVGAVSSEDCFITQNGQVVGEGIYVRYEMWLRRLESNVNSLVGLSGSFFAARRNVCENWDTRVPSDFNTAINCVKKGYVAVSDERIKGYYKDVKEDGKEYQRKWRTVNRGLSGIYYSPGVLNPFKYGLFSFQIWSHKVMRWAVPWFIIGLLLVSASLMGNGWIYLVVFIALLAFLAASGVAFASSRCRAVPFMRVTYYLAQANLAAAHAAVSFLLGKRIVIWQPSSR